jgi:hypothetical protein
MDVAYIDGHPEFVGQQAAARVAAVCPPLRWQLDSLRLDDVVDVLNRRESGTGWPNSSTAVEVGALQGIPRCREVMAGERFSWADPFGDHAAVKLFDGDALPREIGSLVCRTERLYGSPFALQRNGHPSRRGILRLAFDLPQLAAADDGS